MAFPPQEPDGDRMIESMAEQYRAQATRYHALADQVVCPAREALYLRLERGYRTLAQFALVRAIGRSGCSSGAARPTEAGLRSNRGDLAPLL
jgi:hypothetical protein